MAPVQVVERLDRADGALAFVHVTIGRGDVDGWRRERSRPRARERVPRRGGAGILTAFRTGSSRARSSLAVRDVPAAIELAGAHAMMTLGENILVADAERASVAVIEKLPGGSGDPRGRADRCLQPSARRRVSTG